MKIIDKILGRKPAAPAPGKLALPTWLRKNAVQLPPWAKVGTIERTDVSMQVIVDTDAAFQEWIGILGLKPEEIDQFWLEVIYQCVKLDVQSALARTEFDVRVRAMPVEIKMVRAPQWEQAKFPDHHATTMLVNGVKKKVTGPERASQGKEAREHYKRIRGSLPM